MAEERRDGDNAGEPVQRIALDQLQFQAMIAEVTRQLQGHAEQIYAHVIPPNNELAGAAGVAGAGGIREVAARQPIRARRAAPAVVADEQEEWAEDADDERPLRANNRRPHGEDHFGNLKLKIPSFQGKADPDVYLEWEQKIESVFKCQRLTEERKVRLAATEFEGYAINWWQNVSNIRRRDGDEQVTSWHEMKEVMRARFVPAHYGRDLHKKLRKLTQGSKSVEEYHQEMETLMIKAKIDEDVEATMARFLDGVNRDIQDRLEMQDYATLEEMVHKAILIEQQNKRRSNTRYPTSSASKSSYAKDDKAYSRPKESGGSTSTTTSRDDKGKETTPPSRTRNIKCYRCQGYGHYASECTSKKIMIVLDNGEVISEDEKPEGESDEEDVEYPVKGEMLVTRRALNVQAKSKETEQRENLFHTRCLIKDKVCSLIIDGGSCTNAASETLVEKLGLSVQKHPRPYMLQWLNDTGELKVNKQVKVPLSVGRYQDEILCDVLPMDSSHILLGRPWQYDKRALHDGFTNRHSFLQGGKQITLVPLTPQEVQEDQITLKRRKEEAKALLVREAEQPPCFGFIAL
ncbi:uncharacterized protein LOC130505861 [Raphanus sativus]|uniref:Uncharacterized protein LOC130505861 n=1 Tax=Raphanus sativus TaxID=3726 RepID=A0A9W3CXV0_RAPSA|nr:uncharacterized protein LOC130505861 [Raphanus sativus]